MKVFIEFIHYSGRLSLPILYLPVIILITFSCKKEEEIVFRERFLLSSMEVNPIFFHDNVSERWENEFDRDYRIRKKRYYTNDEFSGEINNYRYDEANRTIYADQYNRNGRKIASIVWNFDKAGNEIKTETKINNKAWVAYTYEYDTKNLVRNEKYDVNGILIYELKNFVYDQSGNPVHLVRYDYSTDNLNFTPLLYKSITDRTSGDSFCNTYSYMYDYTPEGRVSERTDFGNGRIINLHQSYGYDDAGNTISWITRGEEMRTDLSWKKAEVNPEKVSYNFKTY